MSTAAAAGSLHLVPASLGDAPVSRTSPAEVLGVAAGLDYFIAENPKCARAELKRLGHPRPLREIEIVQLPEHARAGELEELLAPLRSGRSAGLMSDAGCPAVADPGAQLVAAAHRLGLRVVPHVGPSSILLALMASGLDGQRFAFHGYLPVAESERDQRIRSLEAESARGAQTQIFIETPYRNERLYDALLAVLRPATRLAVARDLTAADEWIGSASVAQWRKRARPELARRPAIFLLLAA